MTCKQPSIITTCLRYLLYEGSWRGYDPANQKYQLLKELGFSYFCSVDSNLGWTQLGNEYFRMGRANVDGQRMC